MADEIVLNFQDSLLRKSDVELLEEGQWLNDKIIGFMFEYFEYEQFKMLDDVLFVNPDVVQCIKLSKGPELEIFLEPLQISCKNIIFLPVNNHENPEATGGMHWSLLVYDKNISKFKHYDSCSMFNTSQAMMLSNIIKPFLKARERVNFIEAECPQQSNSYDCGMYVISVTESLCKQQQQQTVSLKSLLDDVSSISTKKKRQEIKKIIEHLRTR